MATIQARRGSGDTAVTTLRLPNEMLKEVKIQAIREGRSFNTHVLMLLKKAAGFDIGGQPPAAGNAQGKGDQEAHFHVSK
jgi:hypothetical protein